MVPPGIPRFSQVTEGTYRGGQPDQAGLEWLRRNGIRTIINLQTEPDRERSVVEQLGMKYIHIPVSLAIEPIGIPLNPWTRVGEEAIHTFLRAVSDLANRPVFVHCNYGKDRTGALVAFYRVAVQGWDAERAYREAREKGLSWWFRGVKQQVRESAEKPASGARPCGGCHGAPPAGPSASFPRRLLLRLRSPRSLTPKGRCLRHCGRRLQFDRALRRRRKIVVRMLAALLAFGCLAAFREFFRPVPLIAPFPTDSETAVTAAFHARPVPGYEHRYFDRRRNGVTGGLLTTLTEEDIPYLDLANHLETGGWRLRERLEGPRDVVVPAYGLIAFLAVYCRPEARCELAELLATVEGVDLVIYAEASSAVIGSGFFQGVVDILSTHGSLDWTQSAGFAMTTDGALGSPLRSEALLPTGLASQ